MIEVFGDCNTLCLVVTIFILFFVYRLLFSYHDQWEKQGVPCFNPSWKGFISVFSKHMHHHEMENYKKFGRVYGRYDGSTPVLTVGDPDILRKILVKDANVFQNRRDCQFGDPVTDNNLSLLSGEAWKRVRHVMTPSFTSSKLRLMLSKIHKCAESTINSFSVSMSSGVPADLERLFGGYTLDVIANCAFGVQINSLDTPDNPFVVHAKRFLATGVSFRSILAVLCPSLMKLFRISMLNPTSTKFFQEFTSQIVEERKKCDKPGVDFLQLLLDAVKNDYDCTKNSETTSDTTNDTSKSPPKTKFLTHDELTAQCVVFFFAGYETTMALLQFTVYSFALNQDIQNKLYEEIKNTLGEKEKLEYEDIASLKYLDAVVCEALRLSTACIRMERRAEKDYTIEESGIVVKKNNLISFPIFCMHRDPEWYPEPEKFDPERFSPEARASRHPFVYLPFGMGPRSCIGNRFALMEAKHMLIMIIKKFKVTLSSETKVPLGLREKQGQLVTDRVLVLLEPRM